MILHWLWGSTPSPLGRPLRVDWYKNRPLKQSSGEELSLSDEKEIRKLDSNSFMEENHRFSSNISFEESESESLSLYERLNKGLYL